MDITQQGLPYNPRSSWSQQLISITIPSFNSSSKLRRRSKAQLVLWGQGFGAAGCCKTWGDLGRSHAAALAQQIAGRAPEHCHWDAAIKNTPIKSC